jgi:GNAT superfamily N-acetyltransferase
MILRGPGEDYGPGSHWVVGDQHGFAEVKLMHDSMAYNKNTMYIDHIAIREDQRGKGFGRLLFKKTEKFARNLGVDYIQLDSESEAVGFWKKMGFKKLDVVYYKEKTAMIKRV